jgi:uncharacterized protein
MALWTQTGGVDGTCLGRELVAMDYRKIITINPGKRSGTVHSEMFELFDAGDRVFALGTYSGRAKATGKMFSARFSHLWTLEGGVLVRLQQCADAAQLVRALEK